MKKRFYITGLVYLAFYILSIQVVSAQSYADSIRDSLRHDPKNPALINSLCEATLPDSLDAVRVLAKKAIALADASKNYYQKGRAEFIMGDTWWYAQDFAEAARWFGKSAESYRQAGDPLMTANGYNDMAYAWNQIDRYTEALAAYRKSMNILLSIDDEENLPAVLINIGQVHNKLGSIDSSIFYNNQAASLSDVPGLEETYSAALSNLGFNYKTLGDFEKAISYYNKAFGISKKMEMESWMATDLNNIANVYTLWGKYEMAKKYLKQAIAITGKLNDRAGQEIQLNNLAYAYQQSGDPDSALILYKQSADIAQELGRIGNLAVRKINIGILYYKNGAYDTAAKYVEEGIETNRKLGLRLSVCGALQNLGMIRMAQNDLQRAEANLNEALEIATDLDARIILQRIYEGLSKLYEKKGDYASALDYHRKFMATKDSVFNNQSQEKLAEMQARYETEKKQQQIELLIKDNELQKSDLRKKQITLFSLGAGLIIIAISAIVIWMMYLQKARANRKLVEKNLEMMKKEEPGTSGIKPTGVPSQLPDDEKSRILENLEHLMQEQKYYRQQITLSGLASTLQTNTSYLSRIINEHYRMNFSNFLNTYRIREAQRMFTRNQHKSMTLEGIAESVGYQSRSTFNAAFKKITGVTPSVFIKNMEEINKNIEMNN